MTAGEHHAQLLVANRVLAERLVDCRRDRPLAVEQVESSFFSDKSAFPVGSVTFDHALIMRDLSHQWHEEADMLTEPS